MVPPPALRRRGSPDRRRAAFARRGQRCASRARETAPAHGRDQTGHTRRWRPRGPAPRPSARAARANRSVCLRRWSRTDRASSSARAREGAANESSAVSRTAADASGRDTISDCLTPARPHRRNLIAVTRKGAEFRLEQINASQAYRHLTTGCFNAIRIFASTLESLDQRGCELTRRHDLQGNDREPPAHARVVAAAASARSVASVASSTGK
jgi:hypothetical protein